MQGICFSQSNGTEYVSATLNNKLFKCEYNVIHLVNILNETGK